MSGSEATFSPTCFMLTAARSPVMLAVYAISKATFSFTAHSACIATPRSFRIFATDERISEAGVPG